MPIGTSMSATADGGAHQITVSVWFVPQGGSTTEQVNVDIDWPSSVLESDSANPPTPTGGISAGGGGSVVWSNYTIDQSNGVGNPVNFVVHLDCILRANSSVTGTVVLVGTHTSQSYTAAVACT